MLFSQVPGASVPGISPQPRPGTTPPSLMQQQPARPSTTGPTLLYNQQAPNVLNPRPAVRVIAVTPPQAAAPTLPVFSQQSVAIVNQPIAGQTVQVVG